MDKRVPRALVVVLRGERGRELVRNKIVADEERVNAVEFATDKTVTEPAAEVFEGFQAGAEVLAHVPHALGSVFDLPIDLGWDRGVVFDHDHSRHELLQGLPDVKGILIDVDGKKIKFPRHPEPLEKPGYIFLLGECDKACQAIAKVRAHVHCSPKGIARVQPVSLPTLRKQERRIVFRPVSDPDFRKDAIRGADSPENLMNDAIFAALRIHLECVALQAERFPVAGMLFQLEIAAMGGCHRSDGVDFGVYALEPFADPPELAT